MKGLWLALILVSPVTGHAASVTVSDTSTKLPGVAAATTAALIDAGLHPTKTGNRKFTVEANGVHCDSRSNAPVDASDPHAGLQSLKCRVGAKNQKDTKTGQPFGDGRALNDVLQKVQDAGGVQLSDCAMGGYCGSYAKSIACTIDTTIDDFNNGGRWSCVFTDGQ